MTTYTLRCNGPVPLYWGGNGWWTRRKSQAMEFASEAEAKAEHAAMIKIEAATVEASDAGDQVLLTR